MLHRPQQPRNQIDGAPAPLVMLPGTLCDARLYAQVLDRLRTPATVAKLEGAESTGEMARRILADAPRRISLCGFSLGAIVALEIVAQVPERVERLALIGCNPGILDAPARNARAALLQTDFAGDDDALLVHLMARQTSAESYRQQTRMTLDRADSRPRLRRIAVPTLVLCGSRDRICPPAMSTAIAEAISGSRLAIVPGAGHYLPLERPDVVAGELTAWLAVPAHHPAKETS